MTVPINADNPIVSEILASRRRTYSERFFESLTEGQTAGEVTLMQTSVGNALVSTVQRYKDGKF